LFQRENEQHAVTNCDHIEKKRLISTRCRGQQDAINLVRSNQDVLALSRMLCSVFGRSMRSTTL